MENNNDNPAYVNPLNPNSNDAPPDPSNTTAHVGQKVEQGVISKKAGISEQSAQWEDEQENNPPAPIISEDAKNLIKDPSPEEVNHDEKEPRE